MFRSLLIVCSLFALTASLHAQTTGTLTGRVLTEEAGTPLAGATVEVLITDSARSTATDANGRFTMEGLPTGIFAVRASLQGHSTVLVPEVWVRAGKEEQVELRLEADAKDLKEAEVSTVRRTESLGAHTITVEQSLRYPAMFFDPARVAGSMAGVGGMNDQANHLTIRGNSPNANAWLLEGAEMVNPNHLSNAGTQTDLPTLSGGGVNILSAQMLGTSRLLTGNLPTDRGNALGGIMDMNLRPGNNAEQEWTAQAGLIGLDVATEGPFAKGKRGSYLANYRYSTLGLLSAAGVDLGDEVITFQDLSLHVTLPFGQRGEVRVFGLGGTSSNVFKAEIDTTLWEYDKDNSDITYTAKTGAAGASLKLPIGERGTLRTTVVLSATEQEREQINYSTDLTELYRSTNTLAEQKLSLVAAYDGAVGGRFRYTIGGSAMERRLTNVLKEDVTGWLLRPYANGRWSATDRLQISLGMGYAQYTFNNSSAAEPRASVQWRMRKDRRLALTYGWRSMLPWQQVMKVRFNESTSWNEDIGLTRSEDIVLGYDHPFNERVSVHLEGYQQRLSDLGAPDPRLSWANGGEGGMLVNAWDAPVLFDLIPTGNATNTGLELTLAHTFAKGYFYQVNGTVYNSAYELSGIDTPTRWSGNYRANVMGGAEWAKVKEDRVRTWGVSGRLAVAGGLRYTPFEVEHRTAGVFLNYGAPWSAQLNDFFRMDLRVYLKRDRKGRTGMWALDLQNVTNTQNEAYVYYDQRKGEVETKYQLGLIPNLSYRIEF
ncbi:MAG: carboxypeptidase regulatory-like domain-containing protein [Flavobacteriales bacterium]|nr:carboxypeptidase regulatory-like domain-containing protein [Flavobacteriales bacterium]